VYEREYSDYRGPDTRLREHPREAAASEPA